MTLSAEAAPTISRSRWDLFMTTEDTSKIKSPLTRFLDALSNVTMIITGFAMVFMTAIFGWLVFGRYVLNSTPTWVEQYSLLLIVYIGFLGASVGVHRQTHLGISVFREMSPEPVRRIFDFLVHGIMASFGLLMAVYGYKLTLFKWGTDIPLIQISEGWRALPVSLGGGLIFIYSIAHLIEFFANGKNPENAD